VETLLNTQSGLLGVSGVTNDMRVLFQELKGLDGRRVGLPFRCSVIEPGNTSEPSCLHGGADAVIFTGGTEKTPEIRLDLRRTRMGRAGRPDVFPAR